jgi:hypothetical protein
VIQHSCKAKKSNHQQPGAIEGKRCYVCLKTCLQHRSCLSCTVIAQYVHRTEAQKQICALFFVYRKLRGCAAALSPANSVNGRLNVVSYYDIQCADILKSEIHKNYARPGVLTAVTSGSKLYFKWWQYVTPKRC